MTLAYFHIDRDALSNLAKESILVINECSNIYKSVTENN